MKSGSLWKHARFAAPLGCIGVWACLAPPVESPKTVVTQQTDVRVAQNVKNKVDLLFAIDNSPSMAPKQNELKNRFPQLIKILEQFGTAGNPAWYHIGVVSSDLGAGQFTLGQGQCHPGGDGGKLQAIGAAGSMTCGKLGSNFNFIDYNQLNNTNNLPAGQDLATTFSCMASVGDRGCGFEYQLESAYKALHDPIPENQGFLRPDAILAVVFVTDEDDCSAPPDTDLFDPTKSQYGALLSYRCTQYGVMCGTPPALMPYGDSGGQLQACVSAPPASGGKLIDIQKYVNYFTQPAGSGGVKVDPNDVILMGIIAPPSPVSAILANPNPQPPGPYAQCPGPVDGKTCAVVLQHSCIAPANTSFFGDPAVRIAAVIESAKNKNITPICDTDYSGAIQKLGDLIISAIQPGCLNSPVVNSADPDCVVEDVTVNPDGTTKITEIPSCVRNGGKTTCWKLNPNDKCPPIALLKSNGSCEYQKFGVNIDRGPGGQPPANTSARVACATIAPDPKITMTCTGP